MKGLLQHKLFFTGLENGQMIGENCFILLKIVMINFMCQLSEPKGSQFVQHYLWEKASLSKCTIILVTATLH